MMKATIPSDEDEEWTGRRPNLLQYKQPRKGEKQKKKNGGDDALLVVLSVVRVAVAL